MQNTRELFSLFFLLRIVTIFGACDISGRIKKLEILVNEHIMQNDDIKYRLHILEEDVSDLRKEMFNGAFQEQQTDYEELRNTGDMRNDSTLERQLLKRASMEDGAFHAYISSSHHYSNHEIIIFDRVTVNHKSSFTTDDGIFDVPVAGVYAFTWTIAVPAQSPKIVTELVVHGSVKGVLASDSDKGVKSVSGVHPSTAFVVTHAAVGDNVFIRVRSVSSGDGVVLSDSNNVHSTFSAWSLL